VDKLFYASFLIDPSTNKIVEKTYLPFAESPEFDLKNLLDLEFKKIPFEKTPVKCRHNNEVIYLYKSGGILIMAKQKEDAKTDAISYSAPAVFNLRIKENQNKKCW
jgi:hypothetical protein